MKVRGKRRARLVAAGPLRSACAPVHDGRVEVARCMRLHVLPSGSRLLTAPRSTSMQLKRGYAASSSLYTPALGVSLGISQSPLGPFFIPRSARTRHAALRAALTDLLLDVDFLLSICNACRAAVAIEVSVKTSALYRCRTTLYAPCLPRAFRFHLMHSLSTQASGTLVAIRARQLKAALVATAFALSRAGARVIRRRCFAPRRPVSFCTSHQERRARQPRPMDVWRARR
eukprot:4091765-Pleurochrysis_carterae.AAC.1